MTNRNGNGCKGQSKTVSPNNDAWDRLRYRKERRSSIAGIALEARDGDLECARTMIECALVQIEGIELQDPAVRDYLLECFSGILAGESPDVAFGFTREKRGRPEEFWKLVRDSDIARSVAYEIENGSSPAEAYEVVADNKKYGFQETGIVAKDAVKKAFLKFYSVDGK